MKTTQDLAMDYAGRPVAFPPSCGDDAKKYLQAKIEERKEEEKPKKQVYASVA